MYPDEKDEDRRTFLGMVTSMDDNIGKVVDALKSKGLYENTIIVFSSDNGGMEGQGGGASNFPLNGQKGDIYEGGIRVPGFVHAPAFLQNSG